jgi:DNA invertase Pin-like site-specific DNA recombinase
MLIGVLSTNASPGVSTTAMALSSVWPSPVVVVDADPSGGDILAAAGAVVEADREHNLLELMRLGRQGQIPQVLESQIAVLPTGVPVVAGLAHPGQAGGVAWTDLAEGLRAVTHRDVLVDLGRWGVPYDERIHMVRSSYRAAPLANGQLCEFCDSHNTSHKPKVLRGSSERLAAWTSHRSRRPWRPSGHRARTARCPPAARAAPEPERPPRSTTPPASCSSPRCARNSPSPSPPTAIPGKTWKPGPAVTAAAPETNGTPIRIGYARCSSATQELASQLDALQRAHCTRVLSEKISTRIKVRPEFEKALTVAQEIKQAAPGQQVLLTVHEMKRLARNAAELMALSATLQERGIGLELLTGALTGIYDPHGMGAMLFAVLAVGAELDRNYIREKTLEDQQAAAAKGNHGGRPKVIDDDMLIFTRALRDQGTPMPEIAKKLTIKTGKNTGGHPSVASLYRALAEAAETSGPTSESRA